jgi:hypothetical protein
MMSFLDRIIEKGVLQARHIVHHAAKSPHVCLVVVGLPFEELWASVERGPDLALVQLLLLVVDMP